MSLTNFHSAKNGIECASLTSGILEITYTGIVNPMKKTLLATLLVLPSLSHSIEVLMMDRDDRTFKVRFASETTTGEFTRKHSPSGQKDEFDIDSRTKGIGTTVLLRNKIDHEVSVEYSVDDSDNSKDENELYMSWQGYFDLNNNDTISVMVARNEESDKDGQDFVAFGLMYGRYFGKFGVEGGIVTSFMDDSKEETGGDEISTVLQSTYKPHKQIALFGSVIHAVADKTELESGATFEDLSATIFEIGTAAEITKHIQVGFSYSITDFSRKVYSPNRTASADDTANLDSFSFGVIAQF